MEKVKQLIYFGKVYEQNYQHTFYFHHVCLPQKLVDEVVLKAGLKFLGI